MDWALAIEKNHSALKQIVAMLVAMVGLADPQAGSLVGNADASGENQPSAPAATLPRHLHRFVLRLLRPAESAARRLIFIAAKDVVATVHPWRPRKPKQQPQPQMIYVLDKVDGCIVSLPMAMPMPQLPRLPSQPRKPNLSLPLLDPMQRFEMRRRYVRPRAPLHIRVLGGDPVSPLFPRPEPIQPPAPTSDDPIDAGSIHRRLAAIGRALGDIPGQALRMARWQARRNARFEAEREGNRPAPCSADAAPSAPRRRRFQRSQPMRPGRPPGWRKHANHDVYAVLNELHGLAVWARERRDST